MRVLLVCCALVAACSAVTMPANIIISKNLRDANAWLRQNHQTTAKLSPFDGIPGMKFGAGEVRGLDTLQRTGWCTRNVHLDGTIDLNLKIGLSAITTVFPWAQIDGRNMSASFDVKGGSSHAEFSININNCKINIKYIKIEPGFRAIFHSSDKEYDGMDMTRFLTQTGIPLFNKLIEERKARIVDFMEGQCRKKFGMDKTV